MYITIYTITKHLFELNNSDIPLQPKKNEMEELKRTLTLTELQLCSPQA